MRVIFFVGVLSIMTGTIGEGPVNAISSLISDLDTTRKGDEFELEKKKKASKSRLGRLGQE